MRALYALIIANIFLVINRKNRPRIIPEPDDASMVSINVNYF